MMKTINDYAYNSKIKSANPLQKIGFAVLTLVLCVGFGTITTSVYAIIIMGFCCIVISGTELKAYIKLLKLPITFLLLAVIPILVSIKFVDGMISLVITPEDTMTAIRSFVKAFGGVSCMYFISLTTSLNEIIDSLKKLRIPNTILMLIEMIYRYIYVLYEEAQKIKISQASRLGYNNYKNSVKSTGQLIAFLFVKAYSRCDRVYNCLVSRGYNGAVVSLDVSYENKRELNIILIINIVVMISLYIIERGQLIWIL